MNEGMGHDGGTEEGGRHGGGRNGAVQEEGGQGAGGSRKRMRGGDNRGEGVREEVPLGLNQEISRLTPCLPLPSLYSV